MGAPMAVMLLEQLIALGAQRLLYLGFCGALIPSYRIGDLFLPMHAIREEGTSYHYLPADVVPCGAGNDSVRADAPVAVAADGERVTERDAAHVRPNPVDGPRRTGVAARSPPA